MKPDSWSNIGKLDTMVGTGVPAKKEPKPVPPWPKGRAAFPLAEIDWEHLVVADFETYYDADYTLSKLSTSEYIRDARFKAHMVGIKVGAKKTVVIPHAQLKSFLQGIDWSCHDLLCHNTAFDGFILSHHFGVVPCRYYDSLSMARGLHSNDIGAGLDEVARYYRVGNKVAGVLEQSKGVRDLPEDLYTRVAAYCAADVELCLLIFKLMGSQFPATEMALVHETIRMFCDPVLRVDIPRVEKELARELAAKEALLLSIDTTGFDEMRLKPDERRLPNHAKQLAMAKKIIGSNDDFAELLYEQGVVPPTKESPSWLKKRPSERDPNKQWVYAFAKDDSAFLTLAERVEPALLGVSLDTEQGVAQVAACALRVAQLVEARISVKSTTNVTRAQRFLTAGANGMRLPCGYSYSRAHTHRWGGNNKMNLQNLTRGGELRLSILAPPGHVLVVGDSGQIEARVNGWLWGQDDLLANFRDADDGTGVDAYCSFASEVFKRPITKADKTERFIGKVCILALGFGMAALTLQMTLAKGALGGAPVYFELNECQKIVNIYRRKNDAINAGWAICGAIIADMAAGRAGSYRCISWDKETIWLPNGMALHYPDLAQSVDDNGYADWTYAGKNGSRKKIYGGLLCENIVQALARIIVAEQLLHVVQTYNRRLVMITHDEGVLAVPKRSGPKALKELLAALRTPLPWCADLPLNAEGGFAENYSK